LNGTIGRLPQHVLSIQIGAIPDSTWVLQVLVVESTLIGPRIVDLREEDLLHQAVPSSVVTKLFVLYLGEQRVLEGAVNGEELAAVVSAVVVRRGPRGIESPIAQAGAQITVVVEVIRTILSIKTSK